MKVRKDEHHGKSRSPEYYSWVGMLSRCYNPSAPNYCWYGARGIEVSDAWRVSFTAFYKDMGARPEDTTLDRIDVSGNYEPGNCRWATVEEQANNKSNSRLLTHEGKTMTMTQWGREKGIKRRTLWMRLTSGWSIERALNEPVGGI